MLQLKMMLLSAYWLVLAFLIPMEGAILLKHFENTYFQHTPSILSQLVLKEEAPIPHLDHHLLMETICRLRLTCSKGKMLCNHMHKLKHQFLLKVSMQPMLIMAYPLMATELS